MTKKKVKEATSVEVLAAKYAELAALTLAAQESIQTAYRFARDNKLCFNMIKLKRDSDDISYNEYDEDDEYEEEYEEEDYDDE